MACTEETVQGTQWKKWRFMGYVHLRCCQNSIFLTFSHVLQCLVFFFLKALGAGVWWFLENLSCHFILFYYFQKSMFQVLFVAAEKSQKIWSRDISKAQKLQGKWKEPDVFISSLIVSWPLSLSYNLLRLECFLHPIPSVHITKCGVHFFMQGQY